MSLLKQITKTKQIKPRRIFLYGVEGVGKSTFASQAPKPIFIRTEDGLDDINADAFPLATSMNDVFQAVDELYRVEHGFETIVLDSADWFENLIWQQVCNEKGVNAITEIDFGKGYGLAIQYWRKWLQMADDCRKKGMNIIILAHCQVERFNDPAADSYDRYTPRLHKASSEVIREWSQDVLFATYQVFTSTEKGAFGKEVTKGIGNGDRILKTTERPSHKAKNRITGLPDEIPLNWNTYQKYLTGGGDNGDNA